MKYRSLLIEMDSHHERLEVQVKSQANPGCAKKRIENDRDQRYVNSRQNFELSPTERQINTVRKMNLRSLRLADSMKVFPLLQSNDDFSGSPTISNVEFEDIDLPSNVFTSIRLHVVTVFQDRKCLEIPGNTFEWTETIGKLTIQHITFLTLWHGIEMIRTIEGRLKIK